MGINLIFSKNNFKNQLNGTPVICGIRLVEKIDILKQYLRKGLYYLNTTDCFDRTISSGDIESNKNSDCCTGTTTLTVPLMCLLQTSLPRTEGLTSTLTLAETGLELKGFRYTLGVGVVLLSILTLTGSTQALALGLLNHILATGLLVVIRSAISKSSSESLSSECRVSDDS